jgi:predicted lipoprotein with Yx(FWY)xxD motif
VRFKLGFAACALGALALMALGGCGNDDESSGEGSTSAAASGGGGGGATVAVADNSDLGAILVDDKGNTLYMFEKDEADESYCNGACAKNWPPYVTKGAPTAGDGVDSSQLDTIKREEGSTQVAYHGHPLYSFVEDSKTGEAKGNDVDAFGGEWYALTPSGDTPEEGDESGGGGSSGGDDSGGGYSY